MSFQYLSYSRGVGGRGKWGTIAIFTDALVTHQHRDSTTTGCWPSDTLREEIRFLFLGEIHIDICILLLIVFSLSPGLPGKGLHHRFFFLTYHQAPTSLPLSSFGKAGSMKLKLNQTHMWMDGGIRKPWSG